MFLEKLEPGLMKHKTVFYSENYFWDWNIKKQGSKVLILSWSKGKDHAHKRANIWRRFLKTFHQLQMEVINSGQDYQKNKKRLIQLEAKKRGGAGPWHAQNHDHVYFWALLESQR